MKKIIGLILIIIRSSMCLAQTIPYNCADSVLLNTGYNHTTNSLFATSSVTTAVADPYWQVVQMPSFTSCPVVSVPSVSYVVNDLTSSLLVKSKAISFQSDYGLSCNNDTPKSPIVFERQFCMRTSDQVTISGSAHYDDMLCLFVDNIYIPIKVAYHTSTPGTPGPLLSTAASCDVFNPVTNVNRFYKNNFTLTLPLSAGTHKVQLNLRNIGGTYCSVKIEGSVRSATGKVNNFECPNDCVSRILSLKKVQDINCNGIIDPNDPPIENWVFSVTLPGGTTQTITTDQYGYAYIRNLPTTGIINFVETVQAGFTLSTVSGAAVSGTNSFQLDLNGNPFYNITVLNTKCQPPPCDCGQWGSIGYTINNKADKFLCNSTTKIIEANKGDIFSLNPQYTCTGGTVGQACNAVIKYDIYYPNGGVILNVSDIQNQKIDSCGDIRIVMKPTCNGKICPPCEFIVRVNCCKCRQTLAPYLMWFELNTGGQGPKRKFADIKCGETYTDKLSCYIPYSVQVVNPCGENCEPDEVITTIKFTPAAGSGLTGYTITGTSLTANLPGTYDVTIRVKCNGVWCKEECKVKFIQTKKCEPPCNNCKVNGVDKVKAGFNPSTPPTSYTVGTYPAATTLNAAFVLGGGTDTYTQVRANIVDVQLSSDNPACLQCYNTPNQWGSILGGDLAGFTGTVSTYAAAPTTSGNNNPREIVFNTTTPTTIPMMTAMNLNLQLPGVSPLSCCCIHVTVFVKITFRNNKCEECSKVVKIEFDECGSKGDGHPPVGTLNFGGHPQMRQHSPSNEDAPLLNPINSNTKNN